MHGLAGILREILTLYGTPYWPEASLLLRTVLAKYRAELPVTILLVHQEDEPENLD